MPALVGRKPKCERHTPIGDSDTPMVMLGRSFKKKQTFCANCKDTNGEPTRIRFCELCGGFHSTKNFGREQFHSGCLALATAKAKLSAYRGRAGTVLGGAVPHAYPEYHPNVRTQIPVFASSVSSSVPMVRLASPTHPQKLPAAISPQESPQFAPPEVKEIALPAGFSDAANLAALSVSGAIAIAGKFDSDTSLEAAEQPTKKARVHQGEEEAKEAA